MQEGAEIKLNSAEITGIWNSYMQDSLAACVFEYFLSKVQDAEIRSFLEYAKNMSEQHVIRLKDIFNQEGLPVPHGFTQNDVNVNAPSLFTDSLYLWYLNTSVYFGMNGYTVILNNISRPDLRGYFTKCIAESIDLYNKDMDLLTVKGLLIDAPKVEVLKEAVFVNDNSFFGSFFGGQRSILAREIFAIYTEIVYKIVNRALYTGFGQVAALKRVSDFMFRGRDLATKHIEAVSKILNKESIPVPSTSESFVTDSTTAPFSDKLMMYLVLGLTAFVTANTEQVITFTFRKDIQADLARNAAEFGVYALEGFNMMIDNGWMEQFPQVVRRENLIKC